MATVTSLQSRVDELEGDFDMKSEEDELEHVKKQKEKLMAELAVLLCRRQKTHS